MDAAPRPSNRISRLVQPRKYSATPQRISKMRSSSTENLTSNYKASYKRARSACSAETPARTPIGRSHPMATPASMYTDKKVVTEQSNRVLPVLRNHFGNKFLLGGLRSMSAKQFFEIMKYFAQAICGNKIQIHEPNVDDIKRFVLVLDYPHQINKSWFKTPTVSVAYDRIVELLDWLCDFVSMEETSDITDFFENDEVLTDASDIFANQKYVETFARDVKTNFLLWNDEKPEFEECQLTLTNALIKEKTGLTDIDGGITKVQNEYDTLLNNQVAFQRDDLLQAQRDKSQHLANDVIKLKNAAYEELCIFQEMSDELIATTATNEVLKKTYADQQILIKNQHFSASDFERLLEDCKEKNYLAKEKQTQIAMLENVAITHQVKIGRLLKDKASLIHKFNTLIQQLYQTEDAGDFDGIEMEQLMIQDDINRIKEMFELYERIKKIICKMCEDSQALLSESRNKLTSVEAELYNIEDELNIAKKKEHSLQVEIQKKDYEIVDTKYDLEQEQKSKQSEIDALLEKCEENNLKIESIKQQSKVLAEENGNILHGIELKANGMIRAKAIRLARTNELISELELVGKELRSALNNLE